MRRKRYWEMTTEELARATRALDEPLVVDQSRPLSTAEREQWRRVKQGRGGTQLGQGFQRISVRIEQGLLDRVTTLARKRRISRSRLLASLVEAALAQQE
ncbi:MAG TPA: hypothetical protein VFF52_28720 [Isosphaeraceae bacterium]|nr:hypothetical protein [Isosphaeraceae bacterium]